MRKSSFIRKGGAAATDLTGTRPGLHGQTLISSGHTDLDKILGGGLPLGSLLLVLEDGSSRHHASLLRYFLAEGAACGQAVALAAAEEPAGGLAQFIPPQLKRGAAAVQEVDAEAEEQEQYTLRIAWQYRRYLKPPGQRAPASSTSATAPSPQLSAAVVAAAGSSGGGLGAGSGSPRAAVAGEEGGGGRRVRIAAPAAGAGTGRLREWCHEFDLTKGLGEEALGHCRAVLLHCKSAQPFASLVSGAAAFVQSLDAAADTTTAAGSRAAPGQQAAGPSAEGRGGSGWEGGIGPRQALAGPAASPLRSAWQVGRLAVLSLGSPGWWGESTWAPGSRADSSATLATAGEAAAAAAAARGGAGVWAVARAEGEQEEVAPGRQVLQAVLRLKAAVRERRCVAVVSVPAALLGPSSIARLVHLADAVLALESVADDSDIVRLASDSASVAGLLHVRKLPALGAMAPPTPEAALYLIRNKRRRLSITPVEIDPDAEAGMAEGASGLGGAVSVLCGGPPQKDSSALDF